MTPDQRLVMIRERLQNKFSPRLLEVIDDSHLHKGHAGAKDGAGHYTVNIQADYFNGKSRVSAHREIYAVLDDLIPREIHAVKISLSTTSFSRHG